MSQITYNNKYVTFPVTSNKYITYNKLYSDILGDGNTVGWYKSDISTATMSVYDPSTTIAQWNDYLGSGHDLIQNTSTKKPTWSTNGVLFDGIDDYLKTTTFSWAQPEYIYMVAKQATWTLNDIVFDGSALNSGYVSQGTGGTSVRASAGTLSANNTDWALDTWAVLRVFFNGALSKLQINDGVVTTWDCSINNMNGFTLGSRGDGTVFFSNIQVKEIILRKIADNGEYENTIYNYLKNKYSL